MKHWLGFRVFPVLALATAVLFAPLQASAQIQSTQAETTVHAGFDGYMQLVAARARSEGVSENTIALITSGLTPNPRVIALDNQQPGRRDTPPPMASYISRHVDSVRITRGRAMSRQMAGILPLVESRYGVPASIVLAIWGHETNYGTYKGDFDLARSLATLAWEGRRRALFEGELIAVMKMMDQGVPRERLKGSWAGAFGNPQFLPSVYLRLAVDGDGDGMRDIWHNSADTVASIANYFRDSGWRRGDPWGVAATVPAGFEWSAVATKLNAPSCSRVHERHSAWKPVSEWRQLGVVPLAPIRDTTLASLFQPDGPGTPAYLLTGNYRVILQYNCSNYYALSVGLLADEIGR